MGVGVLIAYFIFVFYGITTPLGSVMLIEIAGKYLVDTSIIGYIFAVGIVGGGIAALSSGFLLETIGERKMIFLGIITAVVAGVAITISNYLVIFALGMFLSGLSSWFLLAVGNHLIVQSFHGAKRSSQLNLLNFFFSIGALVTPTLASFMLENGIPWEFVFLTPFIPLGFLAMLAYSSTFNTSKEQEAPSSIVHQDSPREKWNRNNYLTGTALGLYCMLEISYTSWIVVHLRENLAVDIVAASLVLTVFYICQAAGRFIAGFIVRQVSLPIYIICCAFIGLIAAFFIIFSNSYITVFYLTILLGLGVASLYPCILSYGTLQVRYACPRIMTFFLTSGLVGNVLGMVLTSFLKQHLGVVACIVTTTITSALIIVCIGATVVFSKSHASH
jgi:TsgA-like MFS transporter